MADWDTLFLDPHNVKKAPEAEAFAFVDLLKDRFRSSNVCIWDLGCGGGRHTAVFSASGASVFATDNSFNAVTLTKNLLSDHNLNGRVALSDMTLWPFDKNKKVQGVFSWDVLQHNTLKEIEKTIGLANDMLVQNGLLLATIISSKADLFGKGKEIEPNTFVLETGKEAGVPHHYFNLEDVRDLFRSDKWRLLVLAEQVVTNYEHLDNFWMYTPFRNTTWCVLAEKICE